MNITPKSFGFRPSSDDLRQVGSVTGGTGTARCKSRRGTNVRTTDPGDYNRVATVWDLMAVVLVATLDFHLIRHLYLVESIAPFDRLPVWTRVGYFGSLPFASAVVLCGPLGLRRRGRSRPLLARFALCGTLALCAVMGITLALPGDWLIPVYRTASDFWWRSYIADGHTFGLSRQGYLLAVEMASFAVLFSVPELLVGLAGVVVIERRRTNRAAGNGSGEI